MERKTLYPEGIVKHCRKRDFMKQKQMSEKNKVGWNQFTYEAWERRTGPLNSLPKN